LIVRTRKHEKSRKCEGHEGNRSRKELGLMSDNPQWHFRRFNPGDNLSDPEFTKALFSGDDDASLARSLIRETIQNSLDAKRDDASEVHLRIQVFRGAHAIPSSSSDRFTGGLWRHLNADTSGLDHVPSASRPMPCLVMEDFGTHGLRGDPEHWEPVGIARNGFFLFFRALGRSGKSDEDRGRWGVGKFVFPMASQAHAMWGFTIPSDTKSPLLMGRAVLATHQVDAQSYHPDGHWGARHSGGSNLVSPVVQDDQLRTFVQTFRLQRRDEPGLSIVIPWLLEEITASDLVNAVLIEYFLPLLKKELRVTVVDGQSEVILDGDSVSSYEPQISAPLARARIGLAKRLTSGDVKEFVWPKKFGFDDTEWSKGDVPAELLEQLREALETGSAVCVSLQTTVRRKEPDAIQLGYLKVGLQRLEGLGSARPLIVREGISISADKTKSIVDHVAIVIADDGALATLIGDAETPAHEELKHSLLKEKYVYPRKTIMFVREAASHLLRAVWEADQDDDPLLLAGYFPLQSDHGRSGPRPVSGKPGANPQPTPDIPHSPRRFRITKIDGGFEVTSNPEHPMRPTEVRILAAYDVRRGSPFKRYRPYDFDFGNGSVRVRATGCELTSAQGNEITITPVDSAFTLEATGFDPRRDLVVKATATRGGQ
jgi:hypothetical protein